MSETRVLSDLQLDIMRCLWREREATAADVHRALEPQRGLAPTTVATMLRRMEGRGVVGHRVNGRQFVYFPVVTESEVRRSMVSELTGRLFRGDAAALVNHLLTEAEIDPGDLARLRRLIEQQERESDGHG